MHLRSIDAMPEIAGKRVLLRADHNVTFDEEGKLKDDRKLRVTIPTIETLLDRGAKLIIMTHIGRPEGRDPTLRTAPIAEHLATMSDKIRHCHTVADIAGEEAIRASEKLKSGEVLYLENVRFDPGEQGNDPAFIDALSALGDYYVNEAFPSLHTYEEASTCGVARKLQGFAGYHLIREVEHLNGVVRDPRRPLTLIVSGAKMKTKIPVLQRFLAVADHILIGGCIANTFIAARGFDVGSSRFEQEQIGLAQELMLESEKPGKAKIQIPRDVVVASGELSETVEKIDLPVEDVIAPLSIYDIGAITVKRYGEIIESSGTIVWNGPLGFYELNRFSHGTKRIAEAVAAASNHGAFSVIGGGDTIDFHSRYGYALDAYSFVSTGGGAMLEFLSNPDGLPALQLLKE